MNSRPGYDRYLRTRKAVVTKRRYGQSVGKWSGDIRTGSRGPEIWNPKIQESGVQVGCRYFGRLDIKSDDGRR
jgi:hypothetical protein